MQFDDCPNIRFPKYSTGYKRQGIWRLRQQTEPQTMKCQLVAVYLSTNLHINL